MDLREDAGDSPRRPLLGGVTYLLLEQAAGCDAPRLTRGASDGAESLSLACACEECARARSLLPAARPRLRARRSGVSGAIERPASASLDLERPLRLCSSSLIGRGNDRASTLRRMTTSQST